MEWLMIACKRKDIEKWTKEYNKTKGWPLLDMLGMDMSAHREVMMVLGLQTNLQNTNRRKNYQDWVQSFHVKKNSKILKERRW